MDPSAGTMLTVKLRRKSTLPASTQRAHDPATVDPAGGVHCRASAPEASFEGCQMVTPTSRLVVTELVQAGAGPARPGAAGAASSRASAAAKTHASRRRAAWPGAAPSAGTFMPAAETR